MALSTATKYKIVTLLGHPPGVIIPGNVNFSNQINDRLNALPVELESTVTAMIARLDGLDSKLTAGLARAGVKRIDDIEFNGLEMTSLREERKKVLKELASLFDLWFGPYLKGGMMGSVCI